MKLLLSLFLVFSLNAKIFFSPGVSIGIGAPSDEKASSQNYITDTNSGFGLHIDSELELILNFSLTLGLQYYVTNSKVEYDYTNPDKPSDTGSVSSLNTAITTWAALPSLRFYLLDSNKFKFFIGHGLYSSTFTLSHNEEEYEDKKGDNNGFLLGSNAASKGSFNEVGIKYMFNSINGFQVTYKDIKFETNNFETLGNKSFSSSFKQMTFLYIHTVGFDFFWK